MVYLVGAGPGDIGLLTLKACEVLQSADTVIYDRLADDAILNLCPRAKKIYVGKESGRHTLKQSEINQLLVDEARQNKIVVRLKGGDPFVFGRGGEEALTLRENNLPFEIIPGVTSAIAVPAYAGIPVTHRGIATSFAVVTGHEDPNKPESTINWEKISTAVDMLIFLMGVANLPQIVSKLIENGKNPSTPAALIRWGPKSEQKVIVTTLKEAPHEKILPPAIFVVGEVVSLREQLKWFDTRPLFGKKILVTRARAQASKLSNALKNFGADVVECPTIKIAEPSDNFRQLDAAIKILRGFDWIIFTSANGVEKFFERLKFHEFDTRAIGNAKIAAIGSATADKLSNFGIIADVVPKNFVAESLADELKDFVVGKRILIARAEISRDFLPETLKNFGADVTVAPAYQTINELPAKIDFDALEMITFTSSSTVKNFIATYGVEKLKKISCAAIGPITAQTLENFGVTAAVVAEKFTINGLVDAIKDFYGGITHETH
ncbi:MAG: uroporphyrinogen-III C-methyltransferase [Selenomonadaceae bacterium]|nr:uroporphyrinogen-III C-methyltransferase [Selenomonadaceae bacterium]